LLVSVVEGAAPRAHRGIEAERLSLMGTAESPKLKRATSGCLLDTRRAAR
jgi:hypothetical protein